MNQALRKHANNKDTEQHGYLCLNCLLYKQYGGYSNYMLYFIEDITQVVISYEIYQTSPRRV